MDRPKTNLYENNGRNAVDGAPPVSLLRNNGRNAVVEALAVKRSSA
ncbi:hypothetical protein [Paenibacillus sonchi]|nr:hypothetical protein [Paenibacillus sonchi]MCE3199040.1 hypothetical protein [Paenibacillus sonchi]